MEFIVNYWPLLLVILAALVGVGYFIYAFVKMPSSKQIQKVKEWLLYAVTAAEKELGSGTGQIKLRYVYDMFIAKFSYLAKVIPFESFSNLVDEVLENFRTLLEQNTNLQTYVNGTTEKGETE